LQCSASWGTPTSRQSLCALITRPICTSIMRHSLPNLTIHNLCGPREIEQSATKLYCDLNNPINLLPILDLTDFHNIAASSISKFNTSRRLCNMRLSYWFNKFSPFVFQGPTLAQKGVNRTALNLKQSLKLNKYPYISDILVHLETIGSLKASAIKDRGQISDF